MRIFLAALVLLAATHAEAQDQVTFTVTSSSPNVVSTPQFSNVTTFEIQIEFAVPIQAGVYSNPDLVEVRYNVSGDLEQGTPSGFPSFALVRTISGTEFYAQGSSLLFEVAQTANLVDGVQASELVGIGNDVIFTFDGREVDTGRFHPALFQLRADGTGTIQNSNNVPSQDPLQQVTLGEEYITNFTYIPAELTVLTEVAPPPVNPPPDEGGGAFGGSGGGAAGMPALLALAGLMLARRRSGRRRVR